MQVRALLRPGHRIEGQAAPVRRLHTPAQPAVNTPAAIAWVSCVGEKGGAEVVMVNTLRYLDRRRFAPWVVLLRPGPLGEELERLGVRVHVQRAHRMRNLLAVGRSVVSLQRLVRREGIRLLHSNVFRAHVYGGLAARWAGVPEVWTVHTLERLTPPTRLILRLRATEVIANCPRTSEFYRSVGHPNRVIWPGVDLEALENATPRPELCRRYGLAPDPPWISMAARFQRYKGQLHFLRALAALPPPLQHVQGIVIGAALFGLEPDYPAEIQSEVRRLNLGHRVRFTGFIPDADVAGVLAASAVVVHPALEEDFGLSVAEAQCLGRPVVAFATAGPAAILEQEKTGWLAPVGDQPALDAALLRALSDAEARERMGAAGRVRARAAFGAQAMARQTEAVYARCLGWAPEESA